MKNHTHLIISALSVAIFALVAPTSFAQKGAAMSRAQAIAQQLKAIHQQTDPQMKAILSPEQYEKLKQIRLQAIKDSTQGRF